MGNNGTGCFNTGAGVTKGVHSFPLERTCGWQCASSSIVTLLCPSFFQIDHFSDYTGPGLTEQKLAVFLSVTTPPQADDLV